MAILTGPDNEEFMLGMVRLVAAQAALSREGIDARESASIESDDESLSTEAVTLFDDTPTPSSTLLESGGARLTPSGL